MQRTQFAHTNGANVTIISSSSDRVQKAVETLKSTTSSTSIDGKVGDVRDEQSFTKLLLELAPLDHVVFSSVDKIIRGPLATLDLNDAKHLFGVKFWGSVVVGKAVLANDIIKPGGSLILTSGTAGIKPLRRKSESTRWYRD